MGVAFVYYGMAFRVGHCERYPSITLHVAYSANFIHIKTSCFSLIAAHRFFQAAFATQSTFLFVGLTKLSMRNSAKLL
jgi:hypothetical protein